MSDGGQTLLDVIEDPTVLDSFFNVTDSYTPDQTLDSPTYDNANPSTESGFTSSSLDNFAFDSLSDNIRSTVNPIFPQVYNSNLVVAPQSVGSSSNHLFAHQFQNDLLHTPHHPGLASSIVGVPQDIGHQREPCGRSDTDQAPLQQLLSPAPSLAITQQQHHHLNIQSHQHNHVLPSNLIHGQSGSQSMQMQQQNHPRHQNIARTYPHLQSLGSEQSLELNPNLLHESTVAALSSRSGTIQLSLGSQVTTQEAPSSVITSSSKAHTNVSQSAALSGYGKVQLVNRPAQVLPPNIFSPGTQIAGHVVSGTSLLPGNQVLPASSILPGGQVFQGSNIIQGTQILTNVLNHSRMATTIGNISSQPHPLYVSPQNAGLSSQTTVSRTNSSPTIHSPSIGALSVLPPIASTAGSTTSFAIPSMSSTPHVPKVAAHTISSPSRSSAPSTPTVQKSPVILQSIQSPTYASQTSNILSSMSTDGVVSNIVANIPLSGRTGANNVSVTQTNLTNSVQVPSSVKQVVSGGQVLHLVSAPHSKQTIMHQAPKPIQPKPQILPKPNIQCSVRQATPPPTSKTLIGSRPAPPISQQSIVIGAGQQPAVLGSHALGGIVLNPSIFSQNTYLVPQPNGAPSLLVRLPTAPTNQTILASVGSPSMLPMNKLTQPQTIVMPSAGQAQSIVIPQGLTSTLPAAGLFATPQGPRPQQPIYRYVTNTPAPLQIQQIQTATGTTFVAIPMAQPGLSLSNVLAAPPGTIRTISPQVPQTPFQLAPISAVPTSNFGNLQIAGTNYQAATSQSLQCTATSLLNKPVSAGLQPTILLKSNSIPPVGSATVDITPTTTVPTKSPSCEKTPRKSAKRKKKGKETKEENKEGLSINLNELMKQSGIGVNDVMFDETEFDEMIVHNSVQNHETAVEQTIPSNNPVSSIAGSPQVIDSSTISQSHSLTANIPGLENMCFTVDQDGKFVLAQPDIVKSLGNLVPQLSTGNILQNLQVLNAGNMATTGGEGVILGMANDRSQLSENLTKAGQLVAVTNAAGGQTLIKLEASPSSQVSFQAKVKDTNEDRGAVLYGTLTEKPAKVTPISSVVAPPETCPNGIELAQIKVSPPNMAIEGKNQPQVLPISSMFSPHKESSLQVSSVKASRTVVPFSILNNSMKNASETSVITVDRNTYQHKYIESVKPPLSVENNKLKKANKKKKKDKSVEIVAELTPQLGPNGTHKILLPGVAKNVTTPRLRTDQDGVKEFLNAPGASMPSLSFMASPLPPVTKNSISTTTVTATKAEPVTKVSSSSVFSPPGNYIVAGQGARPQNQLTRRSGHPTTVQIMLSPQNQEAYKKVVAQIQALTGKATMTEQEQLIWPKLIGEYNRIMSLAKPSPTPGIVTASKSMVINQRNAIKYSHAIGHQKIILTPTQKKGFSPPGHLQTKDRFNDTMKNEVPFPQSQTVPVINSPTVTTTASIVTRFTTALTTFEKAKENRTATTDSSHHSHKCFSSIPSASSDGISHTKMASPQHKTGETYMGKLAPLQTANSISPGRPNVQRVTNGGYMCTTQNVSPSLRQSFSQPLTRHQLFEHQMRTDQNGACNPDYKTPFKNRTDCCKRTIRYHMISGKNVSLEEILENDRQFDLQADNYVKKFTSMQNKYQALVLKDSMQKNASSEQAMLLRLVNQEEKNTSEREKMEARCNQETLPNIINRRPIGSSYLDSFPWEDAWPQETLYKKNPYTGRLEKVGVIPESSTPDRPESEEPRLQILVDEEVDRQTPESDESIARIAKKIGMNNFTSSDTDTRSPFVPEPDTDKYSPASTNQWNGLAQLPIGSITLTNGTEPVASSPDSFRPSQREGQTIDQSKRERRKKNKSKHRDRSRRRNKNKESAEPDGESDLPESPSIGPIKLVLKKKHEGEGYYSSSQLESKHNEIVENRSKKRRIEADSDGSTSGQQLRYCDSEASTSDYQNNSVGYRPNSNANYNYCPNSNYTYRYS